MAFSNRKALEKFPETISKIVIRKCSNSVGNSIRLWHYKLRNCKINMDVMIIVLNMALPCKSIDLNLIFNLEEALAVMMFIYIPVHICIHLDPYSIASDIVNCYRVYVVVRCQFGAHRCSRKLNLFIFFYLYVCIYVRVKIVGI